MGEALFITSSVAAFLCLTWALWVSFRAISQRRIGTNWLSLVAINSLVFFWLIALANLCLEAYFRGMYDQTMGNNSTKVSRRWFARHWQANDWGIRDDISYTLKKPAAGKRRVTFIGDSFTAGHGIVNMGDRFLNRIRENKPEWEVHGFALPGWDAPDYVACLNTLIAKKYEMDVVVLVVSYNDINPWLPNLSEVFAQLMKPPPIGLGFAIKNSYWINTIYYGLLLRAKDDNDYMSILAPAYSGKPWVKMRTELEKFSRLVISQGGQPVAITFPYMRLEVQEKILHMNKNLDALWRELGIPHLDLYPVFKQHEDDKLTVNHFDNHPGVFAHRLAADVIEPFLVSAIKPKAEGRVRNAPGKPAP